MKVIDADIVNESMTEKWTTFSKRKYIFEQKFQTHKKNKPCRISQKGRI